MGLLTLQKHPDHARRKYSAFSVSAIEIMVDIRSGKPTRRQHQFGYPSRVSKGKDPQDSFNSRIGQSVNVPAENEVSTGLSVEWKTFQVGKASKTRRGSGLVLYGLPWEHLQSHAYWCVANIRLDLTNCKMEQSGLCLNKRRESVALMCLGRQATTDPWMHAQILWDV